MIEIENVTKTYKNKVGSVRALENVSFQVDKGDIYGVVGFSGSGKSTLIRCVNRLEEIDCGRIFVDKSDVARLSERALRGRRQKMGMIFQHFNLLRNDTVYQNVALPLRYAKMPKREIETRTSDLLELVGLAEKRGNYPSQLSGGQKQRVAIARALAYEPTLLLCDEATSALDPETTHSVLQLLKELRERLGLTILIITHEMAVIKDVCDKVAVLNKGHIVEKGSVLDIFTRPKHAVTKQFVISSFEQEHVNRALHTDYARRTARSGGVLAKLIYTGDNANTALISDVSKRFDVSVSVIYGNIEFVRSEALGCLYVAMNGAPEKVRAAVDYIRTQPYVLYEELSV